MGSWVGHVRHFYMHIVCNLLDHVFNIAPRNLIFKIRCHVSVFKVAQLRVVRIICTVHT